MIANNPSGTTHSRTIPTSQDTAIATLAGMKESKEWAGLFDEEERKSIAPCKTYNGQHVWERGKIKHPTTKRMVDHYTALMGPKRYAHFVEVCKCCKRINSSEVVG